MENVKSELLKQSKVELIDAALLKNVAGGNCGEPTGCDGSCTGGCNDNCSDWVETCGLDDCADWCGRWSN